MKINLNKKIEKFLLGFASGVMIAASVWSLLIPSIDLAKSQGIVSWFPATIGFFLGIVFLLILEKIYKFNKTDKTYMMILTVILHNVPEGMAVGVAFAGALFGNDTILIAEAFALAIGIAIQNFPEGAIISMPLKSKGYSNMKAFWYGMLSGIVEPIGALITILCTGFIVPILPYLLSFAAGAMIYVVIKELVPESQEGNSNLGVIGVSIGFAIMMILDVALS